MPVQRFCVKSDGAILPYSDWTARKPGIKTVMGDPRTVKIIKPKQKMTEEQKEKEQIVAPVEVVHPDKDGVVRAGPPELGDVDMLDLTGQTDVDLEALYPNADSEVKPPEPPKVSANNEWEAEVRAKTRNELRDMSLLRYNYVMPANSKHKDMVEQIFALEKEKLAKGK